MDRKGMVFMVILASQSPRRRQLLSYITEDFQVIPSQAEEAFSAWEKASLSPDEMVRRLSQCKARDIAALYPRDLVIGADTIVSVDGHVLEKPADRDDAFHMLKLLSGREHTVCTGVTVVGHSREESFVECSQVRFFALEDREIEAYIATGEPFDKAGGYGIQGKGALLVESIQGDFYNVMGFPIARLSRLLRSWEG